MNKGEQAKNTKNDKKVKIALIALIALLVLAMIVSNHERSKARAEELEAYHAEQFEKMKNKEFEETHILNIQGSSHKIQETRVEIYSKSKPALASAQSIEMLKILEEELAEEREVVSSEEVVIEETESSLHIEESANETVEYKPTKLAGYEISAKGPYEHFVYILSEEDMKYIAKLVWAEARGECYEGKVAVAATVLNRYFSEHPDFNRSSILHIITQPTHFANIWNVTDWEMRDDTECLEAVKDACRGWDPTREVFAEGALYFYNPDGVSGYQAEIRQNIQVMMIGAHAFHYDFEKIVE